MGLPARTTGVSARRCPRGRCNPVWRHPFLTPLSHTAGGRGHQVHKSWPISISDTEVNLDASSGKGQLSACHMASPWPGGSSLQHPVSHVGDFKKFDRTSSSGTMSSSEELVEQEAGLVTSPFGSGEGLQGGQDSGGV